MINHIQAMIWKEWKEILLQRDRSRTDAAARTVVAVVVFAVLVWRVGLAFVDRPSLLLMPAFILVFCVIAIVADSFAGERERHTLETLLASRLSDDAILFGKIASAVLLVWGLMFLMLILGLTGVNLLRSADGVLILPVHRIVSELVSIEPETAPADKILCKPANRPKGKAESRRGITGVSEHTTPILNFIL